ncbi:hypothetical protein Tco_0566516 [Tanacetum coccineum]
MSISVWCADVVQFAVDIITVDQGRCEKWGMKLTKKVANPKMSQLQHSQPRGSRRAWKGDLGIGEEVVTCKLYLGLAFTIPTLKRVTIGCCEVGGGGGGVVGGVGVCGDGVDSGVGGVDCGVERLARLEAAFATTKVADSGNVELSNKVVELERRLEEAKSEQLAEREKALKEEEKLRYRITHLLRALEKPESNVASE